MILTKSEVIFFGMLVGLSALLLLFGWLISEIMENSHKTDF